MKIKYNELKRIINEELVSPKLMQAEQGLNVADVLDKMTAAFESAALTALLKAGAAENYNKQTREYDDAAYQRAKTEAATASKHLRTNVVAAIKKVWSSVNSSGQAESTSPEKSGTFAKPNANKKVA